MHHSSDLNPGLLLLCSSLLPRLLLQALMSPTCMNQGIRRPNQQALFSLIPLNDKATAAVKDEDNSHLVSISLETKVPSFDIGFHISGPHPNNTLVTLGRNDCDIYLRPSSISRIQCSFEVDDLNSGIVMFYDRSPKHNTRVSGVKESAQFQKERSPSRVLVCPGFNDIISMGGVHHNLIEFRLEWIKSEDEIKAIFKKHRAAAEASIIHPRKARTRDPTITTLPSTMMTPLTPDQAFQRPTVSSLRYYKQRSKVLGKGAFGTVWRAVDVDTGRIMAMKHIQWKSGPQAQAYISRVQQEVELMRRAKHVRPNSLTPSLMMLTARQENIADLIASQGWEDGSSSIRIFMGLEEEDLDGLIGSDTFTHPTGRPKSCLHQMLSALDFLDCKGIVHRDVKPGNILCSRTSKGFEYRFRLADFGVGKLVKFAYSYQGTDEYMAPEILRLKDRTNGEIANKERQTPKVDVWSLFITIAYAINARNYRDLPKGNDDEILDAAREACTDRWMSQYSAMVIKDPVHRASALDMLNLHFEGIGAYDRSINLEMFDDSDDIFMDPQHLKNIQNAQRPQKRQQSKQARHPFEMHPYKRIEKTPSSLLIKSRPSDTC